MRSQNERRRRMAANFAAQYNEYCRWVEDQREGAMPKCTASYSDLRIPAEGSSVEMSVENIMRISMDFRAKAIKAIELARFRLDVYIDLRMKSYAEAEREVVKRALWFNGLNPVTNTYESFNAATMPISRRTFYRYRLWYLTMIADCIGL